MAKFRRRSRGRRVFKSREPEHKINDKITFPKVRVVGDNVEGGVFTIEKAIAFAEELGKDLVLIAEKADPPVCKVVDYKKFIYDQKKKEKEIKSKTVKTVVKEIRFGPNTDEHDFEFKLKHAQKFLEEGSKVKAFVHFRGRTIVHKERGEILLLRFVQELEEFGKLELMPKMEGKRMFVILNAKSSGTKKKKSQQARDREKEKEKVKELEKEKEKEKKEVKEKETEKKEVKEKGTEKKEVKEKKKEKAESKEDAKS